MKLVALLLFAAAQADTPRPFLTPDGWGPVKIGMNRAEVEAAIGTPLKGEPIEDEYSCIEMTPGLTLFVKATATFATFGTAGWEVGALRGARLMIGRAQVVGAQSAAIAAPEGGATVDSEVRATVEQVLAALRSHGLIAAS